MTVREAQENFVASLKLAFKPRRIDNEGLEGTNVFYLRGGPLKLNHKLSLGVGMWVSDLFPSVVDEIDSYVSLTGWVKDDEDGVGHHVAFSSKELKGFFPIRGYIQTPLPPSNLKYWCPLGRDNLIKLRPEVVEEIPGGF